MKYIILLTFLSLAAHSQEGKKVNFLGGNTPYPNPPLQMTKDSCTTTDLSPQMGGVREQIESSCYAYAATEIMNFGKKVKFSPMFLAFQRTSFDPKLNTTDYMASIGGFHPGFIEEACKVGAQTGMCPESEITSEYSNWKEYGSLILYYHKYKEDQKKITYTCDKEWDSATNITFHLSKQEKEDRYQQMYAKSKAAHYDPNNPKASFYVPQDYIIKQAKKLFPSLPEDIIEGYAMRAETPTIFFKYLSTHTCQGKLVKMPKASTLNIDKQGGVLDSDRIALLGKINDGLTAGKPAAIGFHIQGLISPKKDDKGNHSRHAATIAGRKWVNGKCIYLVKNSWGKDWENPEGLKGTPVAEKPGYFEMTEQTLMEHVFEATTLK